MNKVRVLLVGEAKNSPSGLAQSLSAASGLKVIACRSSFDVLAALKDRGIDVLVSLVALPDFNGYLLSCLLKSDQRTNALPIIILATNKPGDSQTLKQVGQPDMVLPLSEVKAEPQKLVDIIENLHAQAQKRGWTGQPVQVIANFPDKSSAPDATKAYTALFEDLLTERLVNRTLTALTGSTDNHRKFIEEYFRAVRSLVNADLLGIAIASTPEPWAAFEGNPGLNEKSFDRFLSDSCKFPSLTQELKIQTQVELSAKGGADIGETHIIPLTFDGGKFAQAMIVNYSDKKFSVLEHSIISHLKEQLEPVLRLLIARQEIDRLHSQEAYHASIDPLTGLYNLEFLVGFLQQQLLFSYRQNLDVGLLIMDIDNFAALNQEFSLEIGDAILAKLATSLLSLTRSSDLVARYGADEFAVVLPNTNLNGARVLAEKIRLEIEQSSFLDGKQKRKPHVTLSIGCARFNMKDLNPETILSEAKHALQQAKHSGKNCVSLSAK